jgi:hypothetical protein
MGKKLWIHLLFFLELLDFDPWMRSAHLTAKGCRIVFPILREAFDMDEPPVDMKKWAVI